MTQHKAHHVNYLVIFGFLCCLTAASVVADVINIENKLVLIVVVLAVAVAKALFVMMFFMHLKFEGNWKFVLLAPTMILALGLPMALMPDIGVAFGIPSPSLSSSILRAFRCIRNSPTRRSKSHSGLLTNR